MCIQECKTCHNIDGDTLSRKSIWLCKRLLCSTPWKKCCQTPKCKSHCQRKDGQTYKSCFESLLWDYLNYYHPDGLVGLSVRQSCYPLNWCLHSMCKILHVSLFPPHWQNERKGQAVCCFPLWQLPSRLGSCQLHSYISVFSYTLPGIQDRNRCNNAFLKWRICDEVFVTFVFDAAFSALKFSTSAKFSVFKLTFL